MRALTMLLVFAALAVGAAGCGGSKSAAETSTTAEETTTESTATEETTTEGTETETTESTSTEASGFNFGSGDCRKLAQAGQQITQAMSAAGTDKEKLQQTKQLYQSFVDKAPSEIKPDLQVISDAYSKIVDAITKIDIKPGETPDAATIQKFQDALASIDNAKVQQASQHLASWATDHCGTTGG
jgi:hypothetical protein